jgi:hypothetical protein
MPRSWTLEENSQLLALRANGATWHVVAKKLKPGGDRQSRLHLV